MMSGDRTGASNPGKLAFCFGDFLMSEVRFGVGDISYGRRMSLDTPRETFSLDTTQCRDLDNYLHTAFPALGRAPMDVRRAWRARCSDPAMKLVLVALVCHVDPIEPGGRVDVSLSELTEWSELSAEYVVEALAGLRALNLIRPAVHGHDMDGELMSIEINPEVLR